MTKEDVVVIMGDAGFVWDGSETDKYWQDFLDNKPWTTFCVLGNHENYDMIEQLPTTTFGGEEVYQVSKSVFYAKTGRIYDLCGQNCFVINGADSHDKEYRTPNVSWWAQEQITEEDIDIAKANLGKYNGTVDFVFSHTGGQEVCNFLGFKPTISDNRLTRILDGVIYKKHFCGHYHKDMVTPTARILYNDIMLIATDKEELL